MLYFSIREKYNLGCEPGCRVMGSLSDHFGSCSDRSRIVNDVAAVFSKLVSRCGRSLSWQGRYLVTLEGDTHVAPRIVNNISYVTRMSHDSFRGRHSIW